MRSYKTRTIVRAVEESYDITHSLQILVSTKSSILQLLFKKIGGGGGSSRTGYVPYYW